MDLCHAKLVTGNRTEDSTAMRECEITQNNYLPNFRHSAYSMVWIDKTCKLVYICDLELIFVTTKTQISLIVIIIL